MIYDRVIKRFDDKLDITNPFPSFAFQFAIEDLQTNKTNLKFIVGEPGIGKTFVVKYFAIHTDKKNLFLKAPVSIKELKNKIKDHEIVIVDEAQLLDLKVIEYLRTLSDENVTVILSMHEKESKMILSLEHFNSRDYHLIKLMPLSIEEIKRFLETELMKTNTTINLTSKHYKMIFKYTKGNFRLTKKFIKTIFILLNFAHKEKLEKYYEVNDCIIDMAAIELGLDK
jgi:chromosomal replication initiation ATPase DnaA